MFSQRHIRRIVYFWKLSRREPLRYMPHTLFFRNCNGRMLGPRGVAFLAHNLIWYSGVSCCEIIEDPITSVPVLNPDWSSLRSG